MHNTSYLCSFHIPKTGGTTFAAHARRQLAPEAFLVHGPFSRVDRFFNNLPQLEEMPHEQRQSIRVVHGHGAGIAVAETMRGRTPEFMVILRDPFARFVSGFHHYNNERRNSGRDQVAEELYFRKRSENFFARLLTRYFEPLLPDQKAGLEGLLPILQSFKFILLTEHLDRQLPQVCREYGLKSTDITAQRINSAKSELGVDRAAFDRVNEVDGAIYATLAESASRGDSIENPFGYKPQIVKDYLEAAWARYNPEAERAQAYGDLIESFEKTLKLEAARLKLASGSSDHVADKGLLLEMIDAALPPWRQRLQQKDKDLSAANFWSGATLMKEGKLDLAEGYLREAVRLNPKNDNALAHLARLLHRQGRKSEAKACLSRAQELRPERPIVQALRKVIGL